MFAHTFAISSSTKIVHVMTEACKFWGFEMTDCDIFYENPGDPRLVNFVQKIDSSDYDEYKITTILDSITFEDDSGAV